MAEWPRQKPLIKVTFGWSLAPDLDRTKFEQWYLDRLGLVLPERLRIRSPLLPTSEM